MRCVVSYPGVMEHAQQVALALAESDALEAFATSFAFREEGSLAAALRFLPDGPARKLQRELRRRSVAPVFGDRVCSYPGWEILRTLVSKAGVGAIWTDRVWDVAAHRFDTAVARRHVPHCDGIVAFEYTALASFRMARELGKARVLHMPSLDSLAFKRIEEHERGEWPELRRPTDAYFERKFARRYERRRDEIALADLVIANSSLTKASHVAAGADPTRIAVVPLGAPPPVERLRPRDNAAPLSVLWSGPFTLRKGAHHLLAAWALLQPGKAAHLTIYGEIGVPDKLMRMAPIDINFMGSVPRVQMLEAFETADVLVFPTLSDGFGMVITEALSRGTPVIATDQAGATDLIRSGQNGLVIPAGDPAALRDALQWCLDNRSALALMGNAALETSRSHQWSHYRQAVMAAMRHGLDRMGYSFGVTS